METKKISIACFIGGAICCAVALMVAPALWWLGMVAGFAGGYVSYEFREVRRAVPVALRAASNGTSWAWHSLVKYVEEWLAEPHPFAYFGAIVGLPFFVWTASHLVNPDMQPDASSGVYIVSAVLQVIMLPIAFVQTVFAGLFILAPLAFIGARVGERCYWWPAIFGSMGEQSSRSDELDAKGLRREATTYTNVLRWTAKGIGITVIFFVWTLWKYLAIGIWAMLRFFGRFAWHLFKLIHSQKRVLCGIDGALGGAVAYVWLQPTSYAVGEQAVLVVFGGLLGAAFGVINWEVVSKRILHVGAKS